MTKRKPQWWYRQKGTLDFHTIEPLATRRVHDIMERDVQWLWRDVIPLRKLTLVAGEPGVGKSLLTLDIAARVSTGGTFPAQREPCDENSVLLISSEDDAGDTIKPRLRAADAELDMIYCVDGTRFNLDKDVDSLEVTLGENLDYRLAIIDPLYVGGDDYRNNNVREVLGRLHKVAARRNVAILGVMHLNKSAKPVGLNRVMGSVAYGAAARSVVLVINDKSDPDRKLLVPIKSNLAKTAFAYAYRIVTDRHGAPTVKWDDAKIPVTADNLYNEGGTPKDAVSLAWLIASRPPLASVTLLANRSNTF